MTRQNRKQIFSGSNLFFVHLFWSLLGLFVIVLPGLRAQNTSYGDCLQLSHPDSTLTCLMKRFWENPTEPNLINKFADVSIQAGQLEKGQEFGEKLIREMPGNPAGYYLLARIYSAREQFAEAIKWMKKAINVNPLFEPAFGPEDGLPDIYNQSGQLEEAIKYFQALLKRNPKSALGFYGLGQCYFYRFDWQKSRINIEKALKLNPDLVSPYFSLFTINRMQMKYYEALIVGEQLYKVASQNGDIETMAYAKSKMGHINFFFGNYRKAMALYHEALVLARQVADLVNTGKILNDLGAIYAFLGDLDKGMSYFKAALQILEQTGQVKRRVMTLYNIGLANKDNGYPEIARQYFQESIRLAKEHHFESLLRLPYTGLAEVYLDKKDFQSAQKYFSDALDICREVGDLPQVGYILRNTGSLYEQQEKLDQALNYYQQALELSGATGDLQLIWESYAGIGNFYYRKEMPDSAIHYYQKAMEIFKKIRQDLDLQQLNTSFLYDKYGIYPKLIELLAQRNEIERAFEVAENYKAQALLSILTRGQFLLSELLPDSISTQYKALKFRISALRDQIAREQARENPDTSWIVAQDQEVTAAELELSHLLEKVKNEYERFSKLTVNSEISLAELQKNLLKGEMALEYVVGDNRIFCFLIGSDRLDYIEIPLSREKLAGLFGKLSPLFRQEDLSTLGFLTPELADFKIEPAFQLYQMLVRPVEPKLNGIKHLRIIPDDMLNYLPFELLVYDTSGVRHQYDFPNANFLIGKYSISYDISLSSLSFLSSQHRVPAPRGILAFGDPEPGEASDWMPLPAARKEIHELKHLLSGHSNLWLTGRKVEKEKYFTNAEKYRLLHFATHFQNNSSNPLYSGLVMSGNDSLPNQLLQTYEIFEKPINADLVVLSACNTGLGKFARGEGLIGITRAFAYAGAPAQVVSLWSVADESAAKLMRYFYENLMKGQRKDIALQLAKLQLMNENPAMKDPYYWAPLVIRGDIRPLENVADFKGSSIPVKYLILVLFLVVLVSLALFRSRQSRAS
ncbi:MAG: hypothetical protein Kow0037_21650 [Calditrichia bacterium]